MSSGSSSVTVGYKYFLGVHMALAHGPLDNISRIEVDRRIAWEGVNTGGSIEVDAPDLFGGDEREGGVSGTVDIAMGTQTQLQNTYLQSQLGTDIPAYRGVACAILNQCYMGNNPYLKPWSFRAQRVYTTTNGEPQWYFSKAGIVPIDDTDSNQYLGGYECNEYDCEAFVRYANEAGYDAVNFGELIAPGVELPATFKWDDINKFVEPLPAWVGHILTTTSTLDLYYLWTIGAEWNSCRAWGLGLYDNIGYLRTDPKLTASGNVTTVAFAHNGSIVSVLNAAPIVQTRLKVTLPNWHTSPPRVDTGRLALAWDNSTGFEMLRYGPASIPVGKPSFNSGPNFLGVDFVFTPELYDQGGGSYYIRVKVDYQVWSNGNQYAGTFYEIASATSSTLSHFDGWEFETDECRFFQDSYTRLYALVVSADLSDLQELYTYYQQGFSSWVPPDSCKTLCADMNPAHIIRECLTDTNWGMGYNEADIDDDAFRYAAGQLYDERMGISLVWSRQEKLEDFIMEILRHIDGVLYVSRVTGKFVLKLIRNDNALSDMIALDETNVSNVTDARRPTIGDLTASVTVNFWDRDTGETASVTQHNQALYQLQTGGGGSTTIQYPGFTNYPLANRAALRDLKALSIPFLSCKIEASREAEQLNIGDAFILNWPDLDIDSLVMRVQQMSLGDGRNNTVTIEAVEDVFDTPDVGNGVNGSPDDIWTDPLSQLPQPAEPRIVTEAPYWQLVQESGETSVNNVLGDDPGAGFLLAAAGRQNNEINAKMQVDSGGGYGSVDILDFSPYAYLVENVGQSDTTIYVTGGIELDDVVVGSIAQIEDELVRVDAVGEDSNGTYIVVGRGVLDTTPDTHILDSNATLGAGDAVVFWGDDYASDEIQYTTSDELNVRLRTVRGQNVLAANDAPVDVVRMRSRAIRPYPPGNLTVDGVSYPLDDSNNVFWDAYVSVAWAHRDRLQQTDGYLYDHTEGDIGPETGTEYIVRCEAYDASGVSLGEFIEDYVGSATSWEFDSNTDSNWGSDFASAPDGTASVKISIWSTRDGYESWQAAHVTLPVASGAVSGSILLEDGTTLLLEDGTALLLEA